MSAPMNVHAAARLIVAEGEWFDQLSDEMQQQYIEEHPDSKYAKGYGLSKRLQSPHKPVQPKPAPAEPPKPPQTPKLDQRTEESLRRLPPEAQKFVKTGGTTPNSKSRKQSAEQVRAAAPKLARNIIKDSLGVANGLIAVHRLLDGKGKKGDVKQVASLVGTILGTSVMMAALGASGPVGFLAFMAVKHVAAPELFDIVKGALGGGSEPEKKEKPKSQQPEQTEHPDDAIFDQEDEGGEYGYWDKGKWHPQSKEDWERDYESRGPGKRSDIWSKQHAALRLSASLITATDDEKELTDVIKAISDYVQSGDIPDEAWAKAIQEMAQQQGPKEE